MASLQFLKKVNNFNGLLAWHSRGRGFDSLQLHHEACQGVTEKSVTPFSLPKRQLTANAPVGSDSPGPGRLTHLLPLPGGDLLKIFNRLPGKNSNSPPDFSLRIWTFGLSRCVGGARSHATSRHRAAHAIPACCAYMNGCQRRNRAQQPRRPMGNPGPPLVPDSTLPLAPGFARYTPVLGFFPGPPGVGFP